MKPELDLKEISKNLYKQRWINYPKADEILKNLEMLLIMPKSDRMQNLLIMGESNNGKTTLAKRFVNQHPPYLETAVDEQFNTVIEIVVRPVIMVQCPHIPHERTLYYNILDQLNLPYRKSTRPEYLKQTVINAMIDMKVKILILDEIHFLLDGSPLKQREFLNLIRYISNQSQVSIVALGTDEASFAIKAERQLDTRFDKITIPRWNCNTDFARLLATIERFLPFSEPSNLAGKTISQEIHKMSHGVLGEILRVLRLAALKAIENNEPNITIETLKSLKFVSPFDSRLTY